MAGLISPTTREQIRSASDIVDIIGAVVPLKRAGANFVGLCPFHKEKSPSFNVTPHKQTFHCFGCQKGGDVFKFIQEYENLTFVEAVKRLADRAHIVLEFENTPEQQQSRFLKDTLLTIHEQITQRWQAALHNDTGGQIARDYLDKRKVAPEAVKRFRLGYAPEAWDDTVNWARSKNFDLALVEQAGLIVHKDERYYDRFRGRLMFPICDEQGRVIGFSGRILSGDEKTAKYVNSPETPLFTKSKVIFGLDKAKRALLDQQFGIICEGQLDLIACHTAGVENVVAPQGTALTAEHTRILKRYVDEVVLCFDADNAGRKAAIRSLDDLLASGLSVRVATIPAPHDPDSYIREFGAEAFRKAIADAESFFDFYLTHLCNTQDSNSDKGKITIAREMGEAVRKTGSDVLLDSYAQKTAQRLAVSADSVRKEFRKAKATQPFAAPTPTPPPEELVAPMVKPSAHEFGLLRFLLLNDDFAEWTVAHMDLQWIDHPVVRELVARRLTAFTEGSWHGVASLLSDLEDTAWQTLVTEAVSERREMPNQFQQLQDCVLKLRNRNIDQRIANLNSQLSRVDNAADILRQLEAMRLWKKSPLTPLGDLADEY